MAEAEQQQFTRTHRTFSADLLTRLNHYVAEPKKRHGNDENDNDEEDEDGEGGGGEIELSLGLSLNGRFGTDPRALTRSSSVNEFALTGCHVDQTTAAALGRTCSLPAEAEEWRRRKEIQSLRRLEAKRKRSEKQKNNNNNKVARLLVEPQNNIVVGSGRKDVVLTSQLSFQGSAGSFASGSSGLSESDSLVAQAQGTKCNGARSPTSVQSPPRGLTSFRSGDFRGLAKNNYNHPEMALGKASSARNVLEDMPCVSTTGLGPNGRRIEGFLYRYSKGEEVRIVCVCHGSFLSPAEFVKHAGGPHVDHPLKHIVVNPTSFL